jgi:RNase P/RNase MRP subunit p29
MKKQLQVGDQVTFTPNNSKVDVYGEIVESRNECFIISSGTNTWIIPKERVMLRVMSQSEADVRLHKHLSKN